jgi:hypothetical protein
VILDPLVDLWHHVTQVRPAPHPAVVAGTGVAALVAVLYRPLWRWTRNLITIAHEGGHALAAGLSGRKLRGIRLHADTSGLTLSAGRPYGPGMVFTLLAGFVTPSLLGLGAAALLSVRRSTLLLWLALFALVAVLLLIRNLYGALSVLVTGAIVFAVTWYAPAQVQVAIAYAATWFLLLGGVRPVSELQRLRSRGRSGDSDADQLARVTPVPALGWVAVFFVVNLAALVFGTRLLLHPLLVELGVVS